jgi:hypothetical protein
MRIESLVIARPLSKQENKTQKSSARKPGFKTAIPKFELPKIVGAFRACVDLQSIVKLFLQQNTHIRGNEVFKKNMKLMISKISGYGECRE